MQKRIYSTEEILPGQQIQILQYCFHTKFGGIS